MWDSKNAKTSFENFRNWQIRKSIQFYHHCFVGHSPSLYQILHYSRRLRAGLMSGHPDLRGFLSLCIAMCAFHKYFDPLSTRGHMRKSKFGKKT